MIRHNGREVFQTPVRDYPRSASVANLLRFSICCRGSRCDRFSMKVLRIFVYCSAAAVILGVFNISGGLSCTTRLAVTIESGRETMMAVGVGILIGMAARNSRSDLSK